jgi:hypothetical protein
MRRGLGLVDRVFLLTPVCVARELAVPHTSASALFQRVALRR